MDRPIPCGAHVTAKRTAVLGIYSSPPEAKRAIEALIAAGFAIGDISVLLTDVSGGIEDSLCGVALFVARRVGRAKGRATLLSVRCDTADRTCRAIDLLKGTGAEDITETGIASALAGRTRGPKEFSQ